MLQNSLSGKTRVLVTHALHFLPQVDYIYAITEGRIAEQGTYADLMSNKGEFSKFVHEFGSKEEEEEKEEKDEDDLVAVGGKDTKENGDAKKKATMGVGLMQVEERNTGAVNWEVYKVYSAAGKGKVVLPLLFFSIVLIQGATVMSSYWYAPLLTPFYVQILICWARLVYWQERYVDVSGLPFLLCADVVFVQKMATTRRILRSFKSLL